MYILSINTMLGGKPLHEKSELYETEGNAIMMMKTHIDLAVRDLLAKEPWESWDTEEARKAGFDIDINMNGGKIVDIATPLENYTYYYIDEVNI